MGRGIDLTRLQHRAHYQAQYAQGSIQVPDLESGAGAEGRGIAGLGQGVSKMGQALAEMAKREQKAELDAVWSLADAESFAELQKLQAEMQGLSTSDDPSVKPTYVTDPHDSGKMVEQVSQGLAKIRSKQEEHLPGKIKTEFLARFDKQASGITAQAGALRGKLLNDRYRADLQSSLDATVNALTPATTQGQFEDAITAGVEAVNRAVGLGKISAQEGQTYLESQIDGVRIIQAKNLIRENPAQAVAALNDPEQLTGLAAKNRSILAAAAEKAAADQQVDDAYASLNGLTPEGAVKRIEAIQDPDVKQRVARRWSTDFELQRTVQAEQQKREQEAAREQIYAGIRGDAITAKDIESFESVLPASEIQGFLEFAQKRADTAQTTEARTAKAGAELRLTVAKLNGRLDYEALGKELSNLDAPGMRYWADQVLQEKTAAQKQDAKDKESAVSRAEARSVASEMMQGAKISQKKDPELWSKVLRRVDAMIDRGGWKSFDELEKAIQHELDMGVIRDSGFLRDDRVRRVEARQPDGALNPDWYLEPDDAGEQRTKDLLRSSGLPTDEDSIEDAYTYMQTKYGDAWPRVDETPAGPTTAKPDANTPTKGEEISGKELDQKLTYRKREPTS
jgi:hypothetical protein